MMIIKGIILWCTGLFVLLYMSAIDSLTAMGVLVGLLISVLMILACTLLINKSELEILSGNRLLKRLLEGKS